VADIGTTLRNARIERGLTISQAAQDTRISPRFLEALEAEQFDSLPAPVYVRGFLRSYANYLRLDAAPLVASVEGGGPPIAGPGAFVGGPAQLRPQAQSTRPDPFRAPQRQAPPPPPPPPPQAPLIDEGSAEDIWAPEEPATDSGVPGVFYAADEAQPGDLEYPTEEPVFRPRRVAGVLAEREPLERDPGRTARLLLMAGGAAIVVLGIVIAALVFSGGDGNQSNPAGAATETPTRLPGTVIQVVSPTATGSASPSPRASVSPSPGASASPSPTGTPATPTPTATNRPNQPEPTATPTETPTPTATPVTPTPVPPTPRPTPFPSHPFGFDECSNYSCGDTLTYRVVCPPDGTWFVDLAPNFPAESYGWVFKTVPRPATNAITACN